MACSREEGLWCLPREVEQAKTVDVLLVLRGRSNSVDRALDVAAGQEGERITCIHGERRILRLHPLPLASLVVLDLQCSDGLAEQESPRAEV